MNDAVKHEQSDTTRAGARLKWVLATVIVLTLGAIGYLLLVSLAPQPAQQQPALAPLAEFVPLEPVGETLTLPVQGFVQASDQVALVSEVNGRIAEVADALVSGGRFRAGDWLVRIEDDLFRVDVAQAEAAVARAEAELQNARNQVARLRELESRDFSAQAQLDDAEVNEQRAASALAQARASLERARIRLNDTEIVAPFDSQVITEQASTGDFVSPGRQIATLFATEFGEVTVALSRDEAELLVKAGNGAESANHSAVGTLARILPREGGGQFSYRGVVDRVSPAVDGPTQTIEMVVRVAEAFADDTDRPPLLLGDLVEVHMELTGRGDWWRVPQTALKQPGRLWRLADDQTLRPLEVVVVLRSNNTAVVQSQALTQGDRVLVSDLKAPVDGLKVRPLEEPEK